MLAEEQLKITPQLLRERMERQVQFFDQISFFRQGSLYEVSPNYYLGREFIFLQQDDRGQFYLMSIP